MWKLRFCPLFARLAAVNDLSPSELRQSVITNAKSVVVKVGTRVLTDPAGKLDRSRIAALAAELCRIAESGRQTIMVSSGAVGAGLGKLGLSQRPSGLAQLQAIAAVGQTDLIQAYESALAAKGRHAAQVLLTKSDLRRRSGYLHVRNALTQIHEFGAIAVVNENDSVAVGELMTTFGDNDRLAAEVAGLLTDSLLVILSDVNGLFDGDPDDPNSQRIPLVRSLDEDTFAFAKDRTAANGEVALSKGGMSSKLKAAKIATSYGHPTIIGPGRDENVLGKILDAEDIGTLFLANPKSIRGRRRWIGTAARVAGTLRLDEGATQAVREQGRSLLAIGIRQITGSFKRGSVVSILDHDGNEIARGLCNYPSDEVEKILGQPSDKITAILGHRPYESVVHRDNLTLTS